ncbi:hypothetical protein [Natronosalvus halobius]|uniref:hypothetical protein n=1 Tax=Natronosalvus halobius TaxID=2953746 RepID=UPI0020A1E73D|nr:hypothetical protein [Natronosalvus halobius]USZ73111.1 hypothetical protein NGM15_07365 [Natronosalvus halobius]
MASRDQASGDRCAHVGQQETVVEPEVMTGERDGAVTVTLRPTVASDQRRPRCLLANPIDTAITSVETETPRVHCDATRNGHVWTISVSDNGIETTLETESTVHSRS